MFKFYVSLEIIICRTGRVMRLFLCTPLYCITTVVLCLRVKTFGFPASLLETGPLLTYRITGLYTRSLLLIKNSGCFLDF